MWRERLSRLKFSVGEFYRTVLYICIALLFLLPLLERVGVLDARSYTLALALVAVYCLGHLGKLPDYSKKLRLDALTGLLNREGFIERVDRVIAQRKKQAAQASVVMLVLDVNQFKSINESLGYVLGDRLLAMVAARLSTLVSERDVLARIGGDEFGILLNSAAIGYMTFCEKLTAAFSEPFDLGNDIVATIGVSVGIAVHPEHGGESLTLLRSAGMALRTSKKSRTRYVLYDQKMDVRTSENLSLVSSLKSAIENHEFVFHYQPQLSLKTGKICGVEALIRWKHPVHGLVKPDRFIGLAEQSNQIGLITSWSLREGITKLSRFRDLGYDLNLSINISPYAIVNSDILVSLTKEIVYNSVPYKSLTVEITESSIDQSPEDMAKIIACLEMLGIQISIDDFGTGHASLLYLKHLPIKEIKIDKAFVFNMLTSKSDASIVKSTIELAHGLNCEVVAEGVETEEVRDKLADMGCDVIQGYYVSKPLIEDEFIALLESVNGSKSNSS